MTVEYAKGFYDRTNGILPNATIFNRADYYRGYVDASILIEKGESPNARTQSLQHETGELVGSASGQI